MKIEVELIEKKQYVEVWIATVSYHGRTRSLEANSERGALQLAVEELDRM